MGLAAELSYIVPRPNIVQRAIQGFASTRGGAWLFSKILPPLDRRLGRITRGGGLAPDLLAGLPVLELTTTGRRSGEPRKTHLIAVPIDDTIALLGTNFGQAATPAWVLNLEAEPRARVEFRGVARDVVAQPATSANIIVCSSWPAASTAAHKVPTAVTGPPTRSSCRRRADPPRSRRSSRSRSTS